MKNRKKNIALCVLIIAVFVFTATFTGAKLLNKPSENILSESFPSETENADATMNFSDLSESLEETSVSIDNRIDSTQEATVTTKQFKTSESGRIIVEPDSESWNLIVVNSSREIPEGYEPKLKEILNSGKYLDYRVAPHYEEMYYAAKKDGITLTPYSAYRSYDRQKTNYDNLTKQYMSQYSLSKKAAAKKAATVILPPGTSEHNLGLAMDICNTYDSFANTKEYAWLTKNAHRYGFILRYTAEKQPVTGIVPEPWHWRYVGVEYAEKIKNSGLCLEEYLDSIGIAY